MNEAEELELLELEELEAQSQGQSSAPVPQEEQSLLSKAGDAGMKGLEMLGRTADMPGGLARTAWKATEDVLPYIDKATEGTPIETDLSDREPRVGWEELKMALQGRAPSEGLAKDIAKDPLTYTGIGPLRRMLAEAGYASGKGLYKGGMRTLDAEVAKYGKEPVSDVLMAEGKSAWTAKGIQKHMDDLGEKYLAERNAILKRADEAGKEVDMRVAMAPMLKRIKALKASGDPNVRKLAETMEKDAQQYLAKGPRAAYDTVKELPVKSDYVGAGTEVGPYVDGSWSQVDMPVQAQHVGEYRAMPKSKGGLPLGSNEPVSVSLAGKLRNWKKLQQDPSAILPGKAPVNLSSLDEQVKMGQLIPEQYMSKPSVAGFAETPGRYKVGQSIPEQYIPKPGEPYLQHIPRKPGPNTSQATAWKTSTYNKIGNRAYEQARNTPEGMRLLKLKAQGLKEATEEAVGRVPDKLKGKPTRSTDLPDLKEFNDKLGRILTTKEKAAAEVAKEARKPFLSQTKAAIGAANPAAATAMKAMELLNMPGPRTKIGMGLMNRSKSLNKGYGPLNLKGQGALETLLYSPWINMHRQREDQ